MSLFKKKEEKLEENEENKVVEIDLPEQPDIINRGNEEDEPRHTEQELKDLGLPQIEIDMAKEKGLVKEENEEENKSEKEKPDKEEEKEKKDDLEMDPDKEYTENEKGLYRQMKEDREKRQKAIAEKELVEIKYKLSLQDIEKLSTGEKKEADKTETRIKEINARIEEIDEGEGDSEDSDLVSRSELKEYRGLVKELKELEGKKEESNRMTIADKQKEHITKLNAFEADLKEKDPNFDHVTDLAEEVIAKDKTGTYAIQMRIACNNPDPGEGEDVGSVIYKIASLHPDYKLDNEGNLIIKEEKKKKSPDSKKEEKKEVKKEEKSNVERMLKNSQRSSSAGLSGGSNRKKSSAELTAEDCRGMDAETWHKIPRKDKDRLMYELG